MRHTRRASAVLSVLTGYVGALEVSKFTHLVPGYGYIPNDDPLALAAGVAIGWATWRVADRLTR